MGSDNGGGESENYKKKGDEEPSPRGAQTAFKTLE